MNDSVPVPTGRTKKYQIPITHLERQYIQQCTDEFELEEIYTELTDEYGESEASLAQFTLDRLRDVHPDSSLLRSNSIPSSSVISNAHNGSEAINQNESKKFQEPIEDEFESDEKDLPNKNIYGSNEVTLLMQLIKPKHISHKDSQNSASISDHDFAAYTAFIGKDYHQSIDHLNKIIELEPNIDVYAKRAAAYFQLNNFDAAIHDYSHVLSYDPNHIKALQERARCYISNEQYEQARQDLDLLRTLDPENPEAEDLTNTLIALENSVTHLAHPEGDHIDNSMKLDTPARNNSPSTIDHPNIDQFHISSSHDGNDDDDGMILGDEANRADLGDNRSDEFERTSRSPSTSPEAIDAGAENPLTNTQSSFTNSIDQSIAHHVDANPSPPPPYHRTNQFSTITNQPIHENDEDDPYDHPNHQRNNQSYSHNSSEYDVVSESDFGLIVQSWLRDFVNQQANRRYIGRPWSRSHRPWSLDKIQSDITRYVRFNDYRNAIDVSKKMLRNGILDYHHHADDLLETLSGCAKCYLKIYDYQHAIQYATEALLYNRNDPDTLMYRARAFENEKFFLFSYADYMRVPRSHFNYSLARHACEKLTFELNSTEGENWRKKIPDDENDHERYMNYFKSTNEYSDENVYQCHLTHADQLYLDGCYVLAIWFYTICIELQSDMKECYLKRAACYLKVFEPQKAINDCEMILKIDQHDFLALYYKASALKIALDNHGYQLILKECVKIQPNNQIVLAEYYASRHEQIPRRKRRIRMKSLDDMQLTYDELEQIRLENLDRNASIDSCDIREQCSLILHTTSFDMLTKKFFELIINITRMMIRSEEIYRQEHPLDILPFSYIKYTWEIFIQLTTLPQIDSILSVIDDKYRILLNELIEYYSTKFDDVDELNRLKRL